MSKEDLSDNFKYPAYSAESTNNGIVGYAEKPDFIVDENHSVYICFGDHTRTFNIAKKSFSVLDNVKVLHPCTDNIYALLFMISIWHKKIPNLGYSRHWKIAKDCIITLPITSSGEIDFDFMESFIRELEEERIRELEEERIRELAAYLKVSGFDNYELSKSESEALAHFNELKWKEFKVTDVFNIKNTHNILSNEIVKGAGKIPYLCASAENNSVNSYISFNADYLDEGNCIFIGGKTFVVSYQESDFFSNDSHNLALYLKENDLRTEKNHLYLATCVRKGLQHLYSWGDSISNKKIQKDVFMLPEKDGKPDYSSMETFISAVQKLVIKDVVLYADKKIAATKEAVKK